MSTMSPEFPIRIIDDEGECTVIESAEHLLEVVDSIDSTDPAQRVWVRDVLDRTVRLKMRHGFIELLEVLS
ncbi:MAG: hypothetical protein WA208_21860 [Thermoanaerobaculia bacterium]